MACHVVNNATAVMLAASGLSRLEHDAGFAPVSVLAGLSVASLVLWRLWRRFEPTARGSSDPRIGLQAEPGSDDA
jgi:hypothetical protein